jgi:Reverse transcriptase (RNA-dependent DNA polymerase)
VLVHVDDCTIAATVITLIEAFKAKIARHIEITDLGELHWLLGIEIKCNHAKCTIHLSQHAYINSILCCYNIYDLKLVSTPMETVMRRIS